MVIAIENNLSTWQQNDDKTKHRDNDANFSEKFHNPFEWDGSGKLNQKFILKINRKIIFLNFQGLNNSNTVNCMQKW